MKKRIWAFTAFAIVVAAGCVRLGIWQLARLAERRQLNDQIQRAMAMPPLKLPADSAGGLTAFRRVTARGTFDSEHEVVLSGRSLDGQPGVHLITPLKVTDSDWTILVDRGWIPYEDRSLPERAQYARGGVVQIQGMIRSGQGTPTFGWLSSRPTASPDSPRLEWQTVDPAAIQAQLPYPLVDMYIVQSAPLGTDGPTPIPQVEVDLSEGPHLGYAIQWFSFAAIALIGGGYWVWRKWNEGNKPEPD
jgi:surfeit locus 1 family protein